MGGWNDKRNDDIDALLGADEKLEDFDDDQENKENKEGVVVEEEMDEAFNFRLNGIGSNVATGWWFVNEGEAVLLAHHDGSCTYYDITNSEARNNARILISGSFSNRYERITRCAKGWESNQNLSRRKSSSSSSFSQQTSGSTRIVYREPRIPSESNFPIWQQNWFIALLFLMALGFFALALFLFITFDSDIAPSSTASAASSEGVEVTYGTVLKLMHEKTKFRLHSHDVPYGSGSGQQSVTGFPNVDDSNSYWIVRPEPGTSAKQGDPIKSGTIIRLQHMRTRKWLHSHLHASPISGNLEVSCFGGESESDTGDYWKLIIEGSGKTWKQDQRIRLQHIDTGGYLHSHDKKYSRIAGGQQEVCGVREKRADNVWLAAEGVYLPVTESK